ncbi:MAG: alkaline phosphatase family protein [Myxococcales bacterium]|nr:alkaline phosphatase family protein [Myxococcales bacterium]
MVPRPRSHSRARGSAHAVATALALTLGACQPLADEAPRAPAPTGSSSARAATGAPALVVVIVVDQMRADVLDRFASTWPSDQGFRWLTRAGVRFENAFVGHAITETAPGHASIATGVHPARHGVVLDQWLDRERARETNAGEDPDVMLVGPEVNGRRPGRSSKQLQRTSVGDWLKNEDPRSRVYAVAPEARASVMLGGLRPDGVFWYDRAGAFVTSSYYAAFPEDLGPFFYDDCGDLTAPLREGSVGAWTQLADPAVYERLLGPDAVAQEVFGRKSVFPYRLFRRRGRLRDGELAAYHEQLPNTPFADQYAAALVEQLITVNHLGEDQSPDLLLVGFSGGDTIGHAFGPDSHELLDFYLRLDGFLADIHGLLDARVGLGRYAVVLTSDHGVMSMPERLQQQGVAAQRKAQRVTRAVFEEDVRAVVGHALERLQLPTSALRHIGPSGVWLELPRTRAPGLDDATVQRAVARALTTIPYVADAYTASELADDRRTPNGARPWLVEYRRSFFRGRSPDVQLRFAPWSMVGGEGWGAEHGSPYAHDTHVPLIIVAPELAPGRRADRAFTVDVAPTVAQLLEIPTPGDLDGRPLLSR